GAERYSIAGAATPPDNRLLDTATSRRGGGNDTTITIGRKTAVGRPGGRNAVAPRPAGSETEYVPPRGEPTVFRTCLTGALALAACSAAPAAAPVADAPGSPKRLNVLFIAVDDLRPELGCYGVAGVKSPHIDALAGRGLVFTRAYCQQAVCNPSRVAVMTGLRPENTGVLDLPTFFRDKVPDAVTVAQHFKAHGYTARSFGKVFHTGHGNHDDDRSWSAPSFLAGAARAAS